MSLADHPMLERAADILDTEIDQAGTLDGSDELHDAHLWATRAQTCIDWAVKAEDANG